MPRFMLIITYRDDTFIGDLNNCVSINSSKEDEAIRNIGDYTINFSKLKSKIQKYNDKIEKIEYLVDFDFEQINKSEFDINWNKIEL